jgi:hypothetical protein
MRRYNVTEAPRAVLTHELDEHIRREEHLNPDRPERADAYRQALQEIEMGAPAAMARRTEFRVNEESSSRYGVTEGSKREVLDELERYAADRTQQGKHKKAGELWDAATAIDGGLSGIRVDHVMYRVVED